jgi:hypothetical protein
MFLEIGKRYRVKSSPTILTPRDGPSGWIGRVVEILYIEGAPLYGCRAITPSGAMAHGGGHRECWWFYKHNLEPLNPIELGGE